MKTKLIILILIVLGFTSCDMAPEVITQSTPDYYVITDIYEYSWYGIGFVKYKAVSNSGNYYDIKFKDYRGKYQKGDTIRAEFVTYKKQQYDPGIH
ncbi:MAG TPA: hypothetical protein PKD00_10365 [Burkholderiales bacterium]|nr:hypothetical protein [Burkholderiales bacterium]